MQDIQRQFGRQAGQYSITRSHATGESLDAVRKLIGSGSFERGLDIATGTGFAAFAITPFCRETLALDVTPEMLARPHHLPCLRPSLPTRRSLRGRGRAVPTTGRRIRTLRHGRARA